MDLFDPDRLRFLPLMIEVVELTGISPMAMVGSGVPKVYVKQSEGIAYLDLKRSSVHSP